jgi:proline dehydrogenase
MDFAENLRVLPTRTLRSVLISLSHRRSLARTAVRSPLAQSVVARFVAGETLQAALAAIAELKRAGLRTTVDVLGESATSVDQAAAAVDRYLVTIAALSERGLDANVSLKLTQMGLGIDAPTCLTNVMRVLEALRAVDGFVRFDMEDHTRTDATLEIWRAAHEVYPNVGVVIQAALRRSSADVDAIIAAGGLVRLCKGAYDEPGSIAYRTRSVVDANYARLMERLLLADVHPALATHDPKLIAKAIAITEREGIGRDRFEFQMLYGVRRDLQRTLINRGYTVRVYVPYGGEWYPYFMRRLAERPANVAFMLRAIFKR